MGFDGALIFGLAIALIVFLLWAFRPANRRPIEGVRYAERMKGLKAEFENTTASPDPDL